MDVKPNEIENRPIPELPTWKAFVVQFNRESGSATGIVAGRVEHLSSGSRARFGSPAELLSLLQQMLDAVGPARR